MESFKNPETDMTNVLDISCRKFREIFDRDESLHKWVIIKNIIKRSEQEAKTVHQQFSIDSNDDLFNDVLEISYNKLHEIDDERDECLRKWVTIRNTTDRLEEEYLGKDFGMDDDTFDGITITIDNLDTSVLEDIAEDKSFALEETNIVNADLGMDTFQDIVTDSFVLPSESGNSLMALEEIQGAASLKRPLLEDTDDEYDDDDFQTIVNYLQEATRTELLTLIEDDFQPACKKIKKDSSGIADGFGSDDPISPVDY
ncbi:hypothetical protein NQ315_009577 [Exocentrus adspersus]|uniref:Uncharacterized protein n=1 Tax=Exocentrus adspersus TaxID=1586481 RepID=A0AAV8WGP6_9CUCU|nr:hypothetical protein NQ315_009577 [Exocentrus adspersus]